MGAEGEGLGQQGLDVFGEPARGGLGVGGHQQEGELVFAQAHQVGALAQGLQQLGRQGLENLVAHGRTMGVVEELEAVNVEQDEGEGGPLWVVKQIAQALQQGAAVVQAGELVVGGVPHERAGGFVLGCVVGDDHLQGGLAIPLHGPGLVAQVELASVERAALPFPLGQRQGAVVHLRQEVVDGLARHHGGGEVQPFGREHPRGLVDPVHAVDAAKGRVDVDHMVVNEHGHALRGAVGELEEAVTHPPARFGGAGQGGIHQGHRQHQPQHGGHGGLGHGPLVAGLKDEVELVETGQHQQHAGEALARALLAQPVGDNEADGDVDGGRAGLGQTHVAAHDGTMREEQRHEQDLQVTPADVAAREQANPLDHQDQAQGGHHGQAHQPQDLPHRLRTARRQIGQRVGSPDQVRQTQKCRERLLAVVTPRQQQGHAGGQGDGDVDREDVRHKATGRDELLIVPEVGVPEHPDFH